MDGSTDLRERKHKGERENYAHKHTPKYSVKIVDKGREPARVCEVRQEAECNQDAGHEKEGVHTKCPIGYHLE